nr:hypothetical protein [Pectinatus sottacetonis]
MLAISNDGVRVPCSIKEMYRSVTPTAFAKSFFVKDCSSLMILKLLILVPPYVLIVQYF